MADGAKRCLESAAVKPTRPLSGGAVVFQAVDAEAGRYPPAAFSMTPAWPALSWRPSRQARWPSRFLGADGIPLSAGRYALSLVLHACGLKSGDRVLLPAYHCGSMVEPLVFHGFAVDFYRLHADLSPDFDDLALRLATGAQAVVLTHFFGFPQPAPAVRELCDQARAWLVEDCAHALFGDHGGQPPGSVGHFAIASTRKFCPGPDGGMACANVDVTWPRLTRVEAGPQARATCRAGAAMARRALRRVHFRGLLVEASAPPMPLAEAATTEEPPGMNANRPAALRWFDPGADRREMTWASQTLLRWVDSDRIAERRRHHYGLLLERCQRLGRAAVLFPTLPPGIVPCSFPLLLLHPREDFRRLKFRGVPAWRWDELAVSGCGIAQAYRHRLLQLPCHDDMTSDEVKWLVDALETVLG
jgi:perosamine synthetase